MSPWLTFAVLLLGCTTTAPIQNRATAAKALFEQTVTQYHQPSAEAQGAARAQLLAQAAAGYERLLRTYPDQPGWCAQALRSLGNVRAEQGQLDDAVRLYARVGDNYPHQEWEVLEAWKSAGDLLWDAGRRDEAKKFYRQIVVRFDKANTTAVVRVVVHASQSRLVQ